MFARPRVVFAVREDAVVVPEEALVPLGTRQLLFKVVDGPGGQKVAQRLEAKVGLRLPGKVEILEGVRAGDELVTAGHGAAAARRQPSGAAHRPEPRRRRGCQGWCGQARCADKAASAPNSRAKAGSAAG
jgi:multidrug efflux pump subunit AcrA (membrane-fusion protein)